MYLLIARDIRARSDAWLSGEAEVLADVSANTPRDALYDRLVAEVAELASREVSDDDDANGQHQSVFFLQTVPGDAPIWVGPNPKERVHPGDSEDSTGPGRAGRGSGAGLEETLPRGVIRIADPPAVCIWALPTSAARKCSIA